MTDVERVSGNDFPKLGINIRALIARVEALIIEAGESKEDMGAVNWGDIGVVDVEYRISMIDPELGASCVVIIGEASPGCRLGRWISRQIDLRDFPNTSVECEW